MPRNALNTRLEMQAAEPLYKQVERQILNCLAQGEWKPGDRLPTESQLAERFGVAVLTVRAGIRDLVETSILVRKQGSGTYVARHDRQRRRYQFTHVFRNDGTKITPERRLVSFTKVVADDASAKYLQLRPGDRATLYRIECLLKLEGRAVALMDIMIPTRLFSGLTARAIEKSEENLYAVYQNACDVNVIRIKEQVHAVRAGGRAAKILGIPAADPALRIDRIAYTYNDVPVEFRRRIHSAADFHYELDEGGI
jgi:GntR family transcriptional regulator